MTPLETRTVNGFTVEIHYDPDATSPREMDPGVGMVLYHRQYNFPNDAGIDLDDFDGWGEVRDKLTRDGAVYVLPVYMLDHSGIALSVRDFRDSWDSGMAGIAYVTRQNWKDIQGAEWTGSEEDRAQAHRLISAEVTLYGQYVNGECYYYVITDTDGEVMEAPGGYIGWDGIEEDAVSMANSLTHDPKCNGEINRRAGTIEHAADCPVHSS